MTNDWKSLRDEIVAFRDARDWKQFHTPKNLASALSVEAADLLEHFQWRAEARDRDGREGHGRQASARRRPHARNDPNCHTSSSAGGVAVTARYRSVIATTNTGGEMLIDDGVEGFIVPVGDDDAMAARLQQLADDPDLRQRMGQAALNRAKTMKDWSHYGDMVATMFEGLVGAGRTRVPSGPVPSGKVDEPPVPNRS